MIRHATPDDLPALLDLYREARARMAQSGNPSQWGDVHPAPAVLERDIARGDLYAIEREGRIAGAFAFLLGEDPTYARIDGAWPSDAPYGTIHRIAGDGRARGIFAECLAFCLERCPTIRIDTHEDNAAMRHAIERNGFVRCGIIRVADGSPRIAYQRGA